MVKNKYYTIYFNIVNAAKYRKNVNCYTEKHHIIPKSLGGKNNKENLVLLTAREHYVAHRLLIKMYSGEEKIKMQHAFWKLNTRYENEKIISINSRTFEKSRKSQAEIMKNKMSGRIVSEKTKEAARKTCKSRTGEKHPLYGKERPKHVKEASRLANLGNKYCVGRILSIETREKMKQSQLSRKKFICTYCNRTISGEGNFKKHIHTH